MFAVVQSIIKPVILFGLAGLEICIYYFKRVKLVTFFFYGISIFRFGKKKGWTRLLRFIPLATTKVNRNPSTAIFLVSLLIQRFFCDRSTRLDSTRPDPTRSPNEVVNKWNK